MTRFLDRPDLGLLVAPALVLAVVTMVCGFTLSILGMLITRSRRREARIRASLVDEMIASS